MTILYTKTVTESTDLNTINTKTDVLFVNASQPTVTITMPPILSDGMYYQIVRIDTVESNSVVIASATGDTINSQTTILLGVGTQIRPISAGTNWYAPYEYSVHSNIPPLYQNRDMQTTSTNSTLSYYLVSTTSYKLPNMSLTTNNILQNYNYTITFNASCYSSTFKHTYYHYITQDDVAIPGSECQTRLNTSSISTPICIVHVKGVSPQTVFSVYTKGASSKYAIYYTYMSLTIDGYVESQDLNI